MTRVKPLLVRLVRLDATVGGQPTSVQLDLTVFAAKQDLAGKRRKIASFWSVKSGRVSLLPADKYILQGLLVDQRKTTGQVAFEVAADEKKNRPCRPAVAVAG